MAIPSLPPKGSTDWYAWAQGLQDDLTDRLSDAALRAALDPDYGGRTTVTVDGAPTPTLDIDSTEVTAADLGAVASTTVTELVVLTNAAYLALPTKDPATLYLRTA